VKGHAMTEQQIRYPILIEPLSDDDGGGFLATAIDLPGCRSDGETYEEALANVQDAIQGWLEACVELGRPIPEPSLHRG
jgi:antitoxin HicB